MKSCPSHITGSETSNVASIGKLEQSEIFFPLYIIFASWNMSTWRSDHRSLRFLDFSYLVTPVFARLTTHRQPLIVHAAKTADRTLSTGQETPKNMRIVPLAHTFPVIQAPSKIELCSISS